MEVNDKIDDASYERARLEEEIHFMEGRLNEMGFEGDCAYERAISRFYQEQIASRLAQIASLEVMAS